MATRGGPLKHHSKAFSWNPPLFLTRGGNATPTWRQHCPGTVPDTSSDPKRQRREERKATVAEEVKALVHTSGRGGILFFPMGRPNTMIHVVKWGYRCCFPGQCEFAAPLDEDQQQTNNRVELKAAIAAVLKVTHRTVIFGEPKYVLEGFEGEAYKWRRNCWCGPKGPIPNSMLLEVLLQVIDSTYLIKWAWSPSHQGILGNEQADELVEWGRCMHPFCLIASPPPLCSYRYTAEPGCATQAGNLTHSPPR